MSEIDWSEAPAGTTHYQPIDDATLDETAIPRPSQTQWRGPEDGLPPVGTVCEARHHGGWAECEIVAHVRAPENRIEAVYQAADDWDWLSSPTNFRPLKSDKERAVEAAMGSISNITTMEWKCRRQFLGQCYDAGLLRLPEEQS